jgi:ABC-type transport system involved in multi-copper enzyme maturation permease subunit
MVGPVLSLELLLGSRRSRLNAFRRVYAGLLILQFAVIFWNVFEIETRPVPSSPAVVARVHISFQVFVAQQFLLLILATPAFVAGAITDEKSQGTLLHLLTADLTSWEIVVGKYLGRMAQVGVLALIGWPLIGFIAGYGQIGMPAVLCIVLVMAVLFLVLGALSLWESVRSRQTREAVLRVYFWCAVGGLGGWGIHEGITFLVGKFKAPFPFRPTLLQLDELLCRLNPLYVMDPLWENDVGEFVRRLPALLIPYGALGLVCLGLAIWRFRTAYLRQVEAAGRSRQGRWKRQARTVGNDPVRWRERATGSRMLRSLGIAFVLALTTGSSAVIRANDEPFWFLVQGGAALLFASFIAGIRASGAVSGERERRTWESLLLTPLETWELIDDKLRGTLQSVYPYLWAYALPAAALSLWTGADALLFTASLLLLTWVTMYYMAATGLWCSARSKSSWRSLVMTFAIGYGYFFGMASILALIYLWTGCVIGPFVAFVLMLAGITSLTLGLTITFCLVTSLALGWLLWRASYWKIHYAESWVDEQERYGRTFTRSLTSALRKHYERLAQQHPEENHQTRLAGSTRR